MTPGAPWLRSPCSPLAKRAWSSPSIRLYVGMGCSSSGQWAKWTCHAPCSSRVFQLRPYAGSGKSAACSLGQRSPTNASPKSSTTETESGLWPGVESTSPSMPQPARKSRLCSRGRTRAAASTGVKPRRPHLRYTPSASCTCDACGPQTTSLTPASCSCRARPVWSGWKCVTIRWSTPAMARPCSRSAAMSAGMVLARSVSTITLRALPRSR